MATLQQFQAQQATAQFKFFTFNDAAVFIRQFQDSEGNILELPYLPKSGLEPDPSELNIQGWLISQGYTGSFDWIRCQAFVEAV